MAPSASPQSLLLLLAGDGALLAALEAWLGPLGWVCEAVAEPEALGRAGLTQVPGLALIDGRGIDGRGIDGSGMDDVARARWVAAVRALPGPAAGTPLLLVRDDGTAGTAAGDGAGIADQIAVPLAPAAARPVLERWAGPLAAHGFRDPDDPHYRLVRLAGREQADGLIRGFAEHLEEALDCAARGQRLGPAAHRIAGLAGLIGFGALTPLWSALDRDDSADPAAAIAATRAVLDRIRRGFSID